MNAWKILLVILVLLDFMQLQPEKGILNSFKTKIFFAEIFAMIDDLNFFFAKGTCFTNKEQFFFLCTIEGTF